MTSPALPSNGRLVSIGTHSIAFYTYGPDPGNSKDPVVLFISGVCSDALNWQAVVRLLPPSMRSYTYDRSGYRNSDCSPLVPTAENAAVELSLLVEKSPIPNPLIFVGHSWAGILIHEFMALKGTGQIAGLVLVDANHETMPQSIDINDPILWAVAAGVNSYSARGIEAEHKLTEDEWDAFRAAERTEKFLLAAEKEQREYKNSFETLRKKGLSERQPLLGDSPVYIIGSTRSRDWSGLYKAGVEKGNGTEAERSYVREFIRTVDGKSEVLQKEFLKLSTTSKLVFATKSGHFIQLTQPSLVVDGRQIPGITVLCMNIQGLPVKEHP
ncbi:Pimeloyl-ACP methyl ester carboxylesterase [Geosmithia morbida]|uniref:Pimeloyl-ACP methyl ester carboxylesterase n=1 Tax=Geosmithia morbida TaxID=1094350 RepID=A0A9P4Z223_9HYPO|nr:Pimeloyl-ACP methyl ester carboxylesterase [Geosmithia morbida]KAF4125992.1 Pimeloyl-ACP methyl ester carboxylesterase [Geosmithia morbida]